MLLQESSASSKKVMDVSRMMTSAEIRRSYSPSVTWKMLLMLVYSYTSVLMKESLSSSDLMSFGPISMVVQS